MKKIYSIFLPVLISVSLFSQEDGSGVALFRTSTASKLNNPKASQHPVVNRNVTPSAAKAVNGYGAFTETEFLWWQAGQNGLSYGIRNDDFSTINSKLLSFDYSWDPGFRLGIGWNSPYDGWDLVSNWTWCSNHTSNHETSPVDLTSESSALGCDSSWLAAFSGSQGPFKRLSGDWRLLQNLVDLSVGRSFYLSDRLSVRPFLGVRSVFMRSKLKVSGSGGIEAILPSVYYAKNNQWSLGPRFGADTSWLLNYGLEIFGSVSSALVYGRTYQNASLEIVSDEEVGKLKSLNEIWTDLLNLQGLIGLGWGTSFKEDKVSLNVRLGWEILRWMNVENYALLVGADPARFSGEGQSLSTRGMSLSARVDF